LQGIDAFLLTLNRTLFLSLRFSNNWLPYYQTDAYFKADPARHFELAAVPGTATGDMRWRGQRISRLIELIEKHLPDPMLLPPPASRSMKHALTRLTNLEKRELYKVIYGTMSHENFRDFRRDKKKFQTWDEKIDTRIREDEANRNFERLMTIREQTKDVRKNLQLTVVKIVDGEIPMRDACALVSSQVDQLRDHVNGTLPWSYRGARLLASELPADLLEFYLAQTVPNYPQAFGIIGPMWAAGPIVFKPLIDYVDTSFIQRFVRNRRMKRARPNYPLAALNQDLTEILQEGFKLELGR
jgi:hypothetical protein